MHAKGPKKNCVFVPFLWPFRPGVPFQRWSGTDGTAGTRNNIKNYIISG